MLNCKSSCAAKSSIAQAMCHKPQQLNRESLRFQAAKHLSAKAKYLCFAMVLRAAYTIARYITQKTAGMAELFWQKRTTDRKALRFE